MKHEWEVKHEPVGVTDAGRPLTTPVFVCSRCGGRATYPEWSAVKAPDSRGLRTYGTPEDCDESLCKEVLDS